MNIKVIQTAKETGHRLSELTYEKQNAEGERKDIVSIVVDNKKKYQEIVGIGGAFTEAGGYVLSQLSTEKQNELIKAYFSEEGLNYSLCRTHINSCDFALGNYAYCETPEDYELEHFSIERDRKYLIPFIKKAMAESKEGFPLFASPWSPPAWMKTNGEMNNGGQLKEECRQVWADYYVKYIKAYQEEKIDIWGLTVQNEPQAVQTWDSCIYSGQEEGAFVRDYLGPTLHKAGMGSIKLMVWDHNCDIMVERIQDTFRDEETLKYVWGIGFHWYGGEYFENIKAIHDAYPDKALVFTEGCIEGGSKLGDWGSGEKYGHFMINQFNNFTRGWTDWNMILDTSGGPNHVQNLCRAPIHVDTESGKIYYENSYYYIGHFSKFVRPGAVRIDTRSSSEKLEVTAFKNEQGDNVIIVMNAGSAEITYQLTGLGDPVTVNIPARAIQTVICK